MVQIISRLGAVMNVGVFKVSHVSVYLRACIQMWSSHMHYTAPACIFRSSNCTLFRVTCRHLPVGLEGDIELDEKLNKKRVSTVENLTMETPERAELLSASFDKMDIGLGRGESWRGDSTGSRS